MYACRVRGFVKLSAVAATGTTVMMRSRMSAALCRVHFSLCLNVVPALGLYERPIACMLMSWHPYLTDLCRRRASPLII